MFSDATPDVPVTQGNNIILNIGINNLEEITLLFNLLKEGGDCSYGLTRNLLYEILWIPH